MTDQLRIGVLGAARISAKALLAPAAKNSDVVVTTVAARDRQRATDYAAKHGIPRVAAGYAELVADPEIDAIYNPLPNGLHGRWTLAAIAAGKHVLCEKPFTANAAEARTVADAAEKSGLVVMEAFHYRYHPLARRMLEIVESGELGKLRTVEASFCFPLPLFKDIRYNFDLAGGALMDAGCYAVHMVRMLGGAEPEVVAATAKRRGANVDRAMRADLRFPAGHTGRIRCSMWSSDVLNISARRRRARHAVGLQPAHGAPARGPDAGGQAGRAPEQPRHLRLPARRLRRCGAPGRARPHPACGLDREHDRDRRDLHRSRNAAAATRLAAQERVELLAGELAHHRHPARLAVAVRGCPAPVHAEDGSDQLDELRRRPRQPK